MKKLDHKLLNQSEKELVLAARPKKLRALDEDELIDLHKRMRKARNKYAKLYRRRAAAQVGADRGRSKASKKHAKVAAKAEIFEDKLAKVSRQLAVVARQQADSLRDERLEAAGSKGSSTTGPRRTPRDTRKGDKNRRARERRAIERRNVASSRASKARKGAKAGR